MLEIGVKNFKTKVLLLQAAVAIKNPRPVMREVVSLCLKTPSPLLFSPADGFLTAFTSAFSELLALQCTFGSWRVS